MPFGNCFAKLGRWRALEQAHGGQAETEAEEQA